jgi:hypothetical protein
METQIKRTSMTHEKARAVIKRLVEESRANKREMIETFHTDPGIQKAVAELRELRKK